MIKVGVVRELVRYPVKSMAGIATDSAQLGWHGLAGDRRFAFRRVGNQSGFPWISASELRDMLLYHPRGFDDTSAAPLPTHVRTPSGAELEIGDAALARELSDKCGIELELMRLRDGIFDDAPISVISGTTIEGIGRACGMDLDRARFRANVYLDTENAAPFCEDAWVGRTLLFGEGDDAPAVRITKRDERCSMISLNPDTAAHDAQVLKKVVELNANFAGVYGSVLNTGTIRAGQNVILDANAP